MVQIKLDEMQLKECQEVLSELRYMFGNITFPEQFRIVDMNGQLYREREHNMYIKDYLNLIDCVLSVPKFYECTLKDANGLDEIIYSTKKSFSSIYQMLEDINSNNPFPPHYEYVFQEILPNKVVFKYKISYAWLCEKMDEEFPHQPFSFNSHDYTRLDDDLVNHSYAVLYDKSYWNGETQVIMIDNKDGRNITYRDFYKKMVTDYKLELGDHTFLENIYVNNNSITLAFGS